MVTISEASSSDLELVQNIVHITWPITYGEILSKKQLDYMLDLFYSDKALALQYNKKEQLFYMIYEEQDNLGFIAIEHNYNGETLTKIHKIYLLPQTQGKGIGKKVINEIEKLALEHNSTALVLNVNRFNSALGFYKKIGFEVVDQVNIDIGKGYLMEDYVMEKQLH